MAAVTKKGQVAEAKLERKLLKTPQTLKQLSEKTGISTKALTLPISRLCRTGKAVVHAGRPPRYSRP